MKLSTIFAMGIIIIVVGLIVGYKNQPNELNSLYNQGYRAGMKYAYDNTFYCKADPKFEGDRLSGIINEIDGGVSQLSCEE